MKFSTRSPAHVLTEHGYDDFLRQRLQLHGPSLDLVYGPYSKQLTFPKKHAFMAMVPFCTGLLKAGCVTGVINSSRFEASMASLLAEHRHLVGALFSVADAAFAFTEHVMSTLRCLRCWRSESENRLCQRPLHKTGSLRKQLSSAEFAIVDAAVALIQKPSGDLPVVPILITPVALPDVFRPLGVDTPAAARSPDSLPETFRPDAARSPDSLPEKGSANKMAWPSCFAPDLRSPMRSPMTSPTPSLLGTCTANQRKRKLNTLKNREQKKAKVDEVAGFLICSPVFNIFQTKSISHNSVLIFI